MYGANKFNLNKQKLWKVAKASIPVSMTIALIYTSFQDPTTQYDLTLTDTSSQHNKSQLEYKLEDSTFNSVTSNASSQDTSTLNVPGQIPGITKAHQAVAGGVASLLIFTALYFRKKPNSKKQN